MSELLFEIGTEELPARFVGPASNDLAAHFARAAHAAGIAHGVLRSFATPRRLALAVSDLADHTKPLKERRVGPALSAARDSSGASTLAARRFAERSGVRLEDLVEIETAKGRYLAADIALPAKPTAELLPALLTDSIERLVFPKAMRWNDTDRTFARPVRTLTALLDDRVLELTFAGVTSGRAIRDAAWGTLELEHARDYEALIARAGIIGSLDARRSQLISAIHDVAASAGATLLEDETLVDEVTGLVERPLPLLGALDERFLELPREVVIEQLRRHQRCFALTDDKGRLLPRFIAVAGAQVSDTSRVTRGYERVLRARLSDARFFWDADRRTSLASHAEKLARRTWIAGLGSMAARSERITRLAVWIANAVGCHRSIPVVERVAALCKADLETAMVSEFPSLQSTIGARYAELDGEPSEVALGISEHCLPRDARDLLPTEDAGAIVGLADRFDMLVGFDAIGRKPSGSEDPFGLRRAASAIVRVTAARGYRLSLSATALRALEAFHVDGSVSAAAVRDVLDTLHTRAVAHLERNYAADVVKAVTAVSADDLVQAERRCRAVAELPRERLHALGATTRRISRLIRTARQESDANAALADHAPDPCERVLAHAVSRAESAVHAAMREDDHETAVVQTAALCEPTAAFLDSVLVMSPDPAEQHRRVALLRRVHAVLTRLADFEQFATP